MNKLQQKIEDFKQVWNNVDKNTFVAREYPILSEIKLVGSIAKDTCNVGSIAKDTCKIAGKKGISEAVNYLKLAYDVAYKPMQ